MWNRDGFKKHGLCWFRDFHQLSFLHIWSASIQSKRQNWFNSRLIRVSFWFSYWWFWLAGRVGDHYILPRRASLPPHRRHPRACLLFHIPQTFSHLVICCAAAAYFETQSIKTCWQLLIWKQRIRWKLRSKTLLPHYIFCYFGVEHDPAIKDENAQLPGLLGRQVLISKPRRGQNWSRSSSSKGGMWKLEEDFDFDCQSVSAPYNFCFGFLWCLWKPLMPSSCLSVSSMLPLLSYSAKSL